MRSLLIKQIALCLFLSFGLVFSQLAKAADRFFAIDIEVAEFDQSALNTYFNSAFAELLVRLSGDPAITRSSSAQALMSQTRTWVQNYQLVNRQVEGVVVGQSVRVEFNRSSLIPVLQTAKIPIWPEAERPRLLVVGDWLQRGLIANFSLEGLGFRPDLDFRAYPSLIGLPQVYLKDMAQYERLNLLPLPNQLANEQLATISQYVQNDTSHVLVLSAQVVGDVVQVRSQYYDLATYELLWEQVILGETFNELVNEIFDRILLEESGRYFANASLVSQLWIEIDAIPDADAIARFERNLSSNSLIFEEVRLIEMNGRKANFAINYRGDLQTALSQIESSLPLQIQVDDRLLGFVRYDYVYSH